MPIVLDSRGWSAASIGLALSFLTIGMVVAGPCGGRLGDSLGRRRPVVLGLPVTVAAVAASAVGGDDVSSAMLLLTLLLFGLGLGVATPSVMTAGIEAAPLARAGSAAGLLSASRYVGSIASTLVLACPDDDGTGLQLLLVVSLVSVAVATAAARALPGRRAPVVVVSVGSDSASTATVTASTSGASSRSCDLDAVGVADPEPLLRDLGDLVAVALDLVLVVDDVAVDLQVRRRPRPRR